MKITFLGLVAHVTLDQGLASERQVAALVAAQKHQANLSTLTPFVIDSGGLGHDSGEIWCFPLTGRVRWPGFPGGKAAHLDKVGLPSLLHVTSGTMDQLSPQFDAETPSANVFHALAELPQGGWLSPAGFFPEEVDFNSTPYGPMPHSMQYIVATEHAEDGRMEITIGNKKIVLRAEAEIVISNICSDAESDGLHFQNYKLLFKPPARIVLNPVKTTRPCSFGTDPGPLPKCAEESTLQVDCGNGGLP